MNTASTATRNSRWRRKAAQLTTTVLTGLVVIASSGCSPSSDAKTAEVVRVVDGDTLVVLIGSEEETVRLLNVDTPETKDPNKPVECMGLEATSFLEQLTPAGTKVGLDFDVEREDRYGRTLADAAKCSLPSELADAVEALDAAADLPVGATAGAAVTTLAALAAALAGAKALNEVIDATKDSAWVTAVSSTKLVFLVSRLDQKVTATEKRRSTVDAVMKRLEKTEAAAATKAKAEKEKKVAAAKAAKAEKARAEVVANQAREAAAVKADQERQAAIERERIRNLPPAPAPYVPPVQQDPYPGYTGPRCYAPGGKSWKPCP